MTVAPRGSVPAGSDGADVGESPKTRWISGAEAFEADVIAVLTRPAMQLQFWVDLENVGTFLDAQRNAGDGPALTYTHLFVKAAGMAAMASPDLHRMYGPLRCLQPAVADVGVSVAAEGLVAPTVVLPGADRMTVDEIARQLREGAARARRDDPGARAWANRLVPFFPLPALRRLLIRLAFSSPNVRRRTVGTIQLTNVGLTGGESCYVPMVGELLLACGAVGKRVVPDEMDRPVVRTGAQFSLMASHRKISAVTVRPFVARFRELLAAPEKLASSSAADVA
jgi:hypothetical protein